MVKATSLPMMAREVDASICVFCNGKEKADMGATGNNYPMGPKCYKKSTDRNVEWDEDTKLKVLKGRLRHREPLNTPEHPIDGDENLQ